MCIAAVALDALLELVGGQMIYELGEDSPAGIHPSLSTIRASCGHLEHDLDFAAANSNRKMRVTRYRV